MMFEMSCPLMSMSALQMAYDSGLSSCPYITSRASGLSDAKCSSATLSIPPVPAVGS